MSMASSCSHSMCIGGVCAEFGARMEDEKSKKMKVKNVPPRPCSHPMRMGSLCTHCGAKVESGENSNHHSKSLVHAATTSKITVPGGSTIHMTKDGAASYQADKSARLARERRLSLVLDIDHTLLHATDDPMASKYPGTDMDSFFLCNNRRVHYIKLRPNLMKFLREASEIFELTLYTHGTREYAEAVAESLDREGKLFRRRIVSACDTAELSQRGAKCLSHIFPCGTDMVLIVDDREDVWSENGQEQNLLLVRPYHFWGIANNPRYIDPGVAFNKVPSAGTRGWAVYGMGSAVLGSAATNGDEQEEQCRQPKKQRDGSKEECSHQSKEGGVRRKEDKGGEPQVGVTESRKRVRHDDKEPRRIVNDMEENDPQLLRILQVAKDVHRYYYGNKCKKSPPEGLSVGLILRKILNDVLRGVCIVFSGIFPLQSDAGTTTIKKCNSSLKRRAELLGASVVSKVGPGVTHVVAASIDTEKACKGLKTDGCCVVHVDWLLFCIWHVRNVLPTDNKLLQHQEKGLGGSLHAPDFTLPPGAAALNPDIVRHPEVAPPLRGSSSSTSNNSSSSLDSDLADFSREIDQDFQEYP